MPSLKDLLKKKEKIEEGSQPNAALNVPEFTFIRSTTNDFETILTIADESKNLNKSKQSGEHKRTLGFRNPSHSFGNKEPTTAATATTPVQADSSTQQLPVRPKSERRLSDVLHIRHRSRSRSSVAEASVNIPTDLPDAPQAAVASLAASAESDNDNEAKEHREALWEKRATILAMNSPLRDGRIVSETSHGQSASKSRPPSISISDSTGDATIQDAIRLHESGDLARSTEMFEQLANPKGANNALAQVLFGLALRHGWGTSVEPEKAIHYLTLAASNSASIEEQALASGVRKGGAAKGELTLAIYELANCFRYGWGVPKDAIAARQYYETAANLGDVDGMHQAAECYLQGFGGAKDKFRAAQYLRLAESKGTKRVGESWIWKPKYDPPKPDEPARA